MIDPQDRMPIKYYDETGKEVSEIEVQWLEYDFDVTWIEASRMQEPFRRMLIAEKEPR